MPVYSYQSGDGDVIEEAFPLGTQPEAIRRKGKRFKRNPALDHRGFHDTCGAGYPIASEALGVHPIQIPEAVATARKLGVPTDYTKDGRPILRDREHRSRFLKAHGFHDRNDVRSPRNV